MDAKISIPPAKIVKILSHLYERVETLENFIKRLPGSDQLVVILPTDKSKYVDTLQSTLVATPKYSRPFPQTVVFQQLSHQSEVVLRVVEKIRKREGRGTNLLTIGYNLMSDDRKAQISASRSIQYSCPNQNTSRLQYWPWKTLLERIGDTAMEYLLETKAIFMPACGTCYIQISGMPLYELWSFKKSWTTSFRIKPNQKHVQTSLLNSSKQQKRRTDRASKKCIHYAKDRDFRNSDEGRNSGFGHFKGFSDSFKSKIKNKRTKIGPLVPELLQATRDNISKGYKATVTPNVAETDLDSQENEAGMFKRQRTFEDEESLSKRRKYSESEIKSITGSLEDQTVAVYPVCDIASSESFVSACEFIEDSEFLNLINNTDDDIGETVSKSSSGLDDSLVFVSCRSPGHAQESESCAFIHNASGSVTTHTFQSTDSYMHVESVSSGFLTGAIQRVDSCHPYELRSPSTKHNVAIPTLHALQGAGNLLNKSVEKVATNAITMPIVLADVSLHTDQMAQELVVHKTSASNTCTGLSGINSEAVTSESSTKKKKRRHRKKKMSKIEENCAVNSCAFSRKLCFDWTKMLYSKVMIEKFPPKFVMQGVSADISGANRLLEEILATDVLLPDKSAMFHCVSETKQKLVAILCSLLRNHSKCRYKFLLRYNCDVEFMPQKEKQEKPARKVGFKELHGEDHGRVPNLSAPVYVRGSSRKFEEPKVMPNVPLEKPTDFSGQLLSQHISHRKVFLFVRACIVRVVPLEMFGSNRNKNVFLKNVQKIVGLGRFERFCMGQVMQNMNVKCSWLQDITSNLSRLHFLAKVLFWLIDVYVLPLLKSYFYITDRTTHRNRLFYYRKFVWKQIHKKGLADYLNRGILMPMDEAQSKQMISSEQCLGIAYLRFLPKAMSLRPIVNLGKKQVMANTKESTINWQLQDLLQVLTCERHSNPSLLGSSKFSLNDIHESWKKFVLARRQRGDERPLYFVKVDIKNCYDSIIQDRLYAIVQRMLKVSKEYITRRYVSVGAAGCKLKRTYHREANSLANYCPSFEQLVARVVKEKDVKNAIFVDQVLHHQENTVSLMKKLHSHLFGNIVNVAGKLYLQTSGIGQGSVISTILCNLYYAEMESEYLTTDTDDLLMRQMDDFLFVTPQKDCATAFLEVMTNGIAAYNCYINCEKTMINFDYFDASVNRLAEGALFPWCGLLIDPISLDIRADYSRYAGLCIRDTISIDNTERAGHTMHNKLVYSMRSKCHTIYLDVQTNQVEVVIENIFKLFLLTAFKFHCFARELPVCNSALRNPVFFVDMIYELVSFLLRVMEKNSISHPMISNAAVHWICIEAFTRKLKLHQTAYQGLLKILKSRSMVLEKTIETNTLGHIRKVMGTTMPTEFLQIVY